MKGGVVFDLGHGLVRSFRRARRLHADLGGFTAREGLQFLRASPPRHRGDRHHTPQPPSTTLQRDWPLTSAAQVALSTAAPPDTAALGQHIRGGGLVELEMQRSLRTATGAQIR